MDAEVLFEVDGPVATITLNRPAKLNAITSAMTALLEEAVLPCNDSDDIRCVILTGAAERAFCVGSDIRALDEYDSAWRFRNRLELLVPLTKEAVSDDGALYVLADWE